MAVYSLLGQRNENVTRAGNLIYAGNRLSTKSQRSDGLSATDFINPGNSAELCRYENIGVNLSFTGGTHHDDFAYTGNLSRNSVHNDGAGVSSSAAWYIDTNTVKRNNGLTEDGAMLAIGDPAIGFLFLVVAANIVYRLLQGSNYSRISHSLSGSKFLFADHELLRGKISPVNEAGIFHYSSIAVPANIIDDKLCYLSGGHIAAEELLIAFADFRIKLYLIKGSLLQKLFYSGKSQLFYIYNLHVYFLPHTAYFNTISKAPL